MANLKSKLEAISARADKATPGPWNSRLHLIEYWPTNDDQQPVAMVVSGSLDDVDFLTHARQDLPRLVKALNLALETLETFKLRHEHAANLEHTRALGSNHGWCDYCRTKVSWGPGDAEIALREIEKVFDERS